MINAAERLLGLSKDDIIIQASDIILGQLRLAIATLTIEEINQDREKFLEQINTNVNTELNKLKNGEYNVIKYYYDKDPSVRGEYEIVSTSVLISSHCECC